MHLVPAPLPREAVLGPVLDRDSGAGPIPIHTQSGPTRGMPGLLLVLHDILKESTIVEDYFRAKGWMKEAGN